MDQDKWVVTAINRLSRIREEISGPMTREQAEERLQRELMNRKYQRYQTHQRLRVEKRIPVQLTLQFKIDE